MGRTCDAEMTRLDVDVDADAMDGWMETLHICSDSQNGPFIKSSIKPCSPVSTLFLLLFFFSPQCFSPHNSFLFSECERSH